MSLLSTKYVDQSGASRSLLDESQQVVFPYEIEALGLRIVVHKEVFSPKHFHGWEVFTRNFPSVSGERVLEIGCGVGVTAIYLAKHGAKKVVAVDINPHAVVNARENVILNGVGNVEVRESDVFSSINAGEKFHTIYWNLPFIYVPKGYKYKSMLERALFDPAYHYSERFLAESKRYLYEGGRVIAGLGDFADLKKFSFLAMKYSYAMRLIAAEKSQEINPVEFRLYELKPKKHSQVFYAMPFTGNSHLKIVNYRNGLHSMAQQYRVDVLEQFIGLEDEDKFEAHGYLPIFIVKKDHELLKKADIVVADYSEHSIGRDCEMVVAKELHDKRVIAIVSDTHMRNHPYIRFYSNYIVDTVEDAFKLTKLLGNFPLSAELSGLSREQKDAIDFKIQEFVKSKREENIYDLLPTELRRRWEALFGEECSMMLKYSFLNLPKTVRINTIKANLLDFDAACKKYSWKREPLNCSSNIFRIHTTKSTLPFGKTKEYVEGMFYIQDLASLLPALALDPRPGERVLDLCAAPGGKTTQMAELMENHGRIVAVDISDSRMEVLKANISRLGISIVEPIIQDGTLLAAHYSEKFDKVLVDGPCSCEGIFRYKPHKFFEWDILKIHSLTELQEKLLESGFKALKPGGVLVYSTCTYSPEENEAVIDSLLKRCASAALSPIRFKGIKTRQGLTHWEHLEFGSQLSKTVRIYPPDNDTLGFFIAKISKIGGS